MDPFTGHCTRCGQAIKFVSRVCVLIGYLGYLSWTHDIATGGVAAYYPLLGSLDIDIPQ